MLLKLAGAERGAVGPRGPAAARLSRPGGWIAADPAAWLAKRLCIQAHLTPLRFALPVSPDVVFLRMEAETLHQLHCCSALAVVWN